jgi:hypothetical protein
MKSINQLVLKGFKCRSKLCLMRTETSLKTILKHQLLVLKSFTCRLKLCLMRNLTSLKTILKRPFSPAFLKTKLIIHIDTCFVKNNNIELCIFSSISSVFYFVVG